MKRILLSAIVFSVIACEKNDKELFEEVSSSQAAFEQELTRSAGHVFIAPKEKLPEYFKAEALQGRYRGKIRVSLGECGDKQVHCGMVYSLVPKGKSSYSLVDKTYEFSEGENIIFDVKPYYNNDGSFTITPQGGELNLSVAHSYARLFGYLYPANIQFNTNKKSYSLYQSKTGRFTSATYGLQSGIDVPMGVFLKDKEMLAKAESDTLAREREKLRLRKLYLENNKVLDDLKGLKNKNLQAYESELLSKYRNYLNIYIKTDATKIAEFEKTSYVNLPEYERKRRLNRHIPQMEGEIQKLEKNRVYQTNAKGVYVKDNYIPRIKSSDMEGRFIYTKKLLPGGSIDHYHLDFTITVRTNTNNILNKPSYVYTIHFQGERIY